MVVVKYNNLCVLCFSLKFCSKGYQLLQPFLHNYHSSHRLPEPHLFAFNMAAAVIDAIGVVSGGLGIISFFQGNLPGEKPPQGAIIKIKAGNPGDEDVDEVSMNATENPLSSWSNVLKGGDIAATYAWDINNNYLGQYQM